MEAVGANLAAEDTGVQEVELEGNQVCPRFQHCRDIQAAEKTWLSQSSALGEGGCCSLSRPSDDLKIS